MGGGGVGGGGRPCGPGKMSFGKDLKKIIAGPMAGVIFPLPHPSTPIPIPFMAAAKQLVRTGIATIAVSF